MKKITKLLTIIFILISLINLSSCGEHQHTFDEGRIIQEASCLVEGIKEYKCTKCDETRQETISKLEHIYETTIIKATCKEAGSETKVCKLCNDTKEKVLEKLEHTYVDGKCSNCDAKDPNYVEKKPSEGLVLELNEDKKSYSVTKIGTCKDTNIIIPSMYNDLPVTGIKEFAFVWCDFLENVEINEGVTYIGGAAFGGCRNLKSVQIPSSVTKIEATVFDKCTNLTSINVDTNNQYYKSIDGNLYSKDGTKLIKYAIGKMDTSFVIPNGVTIIGERSFEGCKMLENIEIPNSVTSIAASAFAECISLTAVIIPDSVTNIGEFAFFNCIGLTKIELSKNVTTIGVWAFAGDTKLIIYCEAKEKPSGWYNEWNDEGGKVIWGYKK